MTLTDTHCHLDLEAFEPDRPAVLERAAQAGLAHILIPGLNLASSRAVVVLASSHPRLHAAIGVHPTEAGTWNELTADELRLLALSPSPDGRGARGEVCIVAIGEIGLDYYWDGTTKEIQKTILRVQLDLAAKLGLPVILHMREARDSAHEDCAADMLSLLQEWCAGLRSTHNPLAERPGVLHSFSGSLETAQAAMRLGFYLGVTGPVTFTNAHARQTIVAALPLERLLIETDAPFQAPHPWRGKRNEPAYVRLIADKIASLHTCSLEQVASLTSQNAAGLFGWDLLTT